MNEAAERVEAEPAEDKSQDRKKRMMEAAKGATTQPEKKAKAAPKPKKEEPKKVKESKKEKAKPKPKAKPKKKKRYSDEEDEESDVGSGSDSDDSRKKSRKPRSGKVSLREELADLGGDGDADVSTARRPPRRAAAAAAAKGFKEVRLESVLKGQEGGSKCCVCGVERAGGRRRVLWSKYSPSLFAISGYFFGLR